MTQPSLLSLSRRGIATSSRHLFKSSLSSPSRTFITRSQSLTNNPQPRRRQQQQHQLYPGQGQLPQLKKYHSDIHPSNPPHAAEYTNSQSTILSAALVHVPSHGFTNEALTLGARDAGFLDVSVQLLPHGEFDLVLFWLASRRALLRAGAEEIKKKGVSVEEKIKMLVMERLRMNERIKEQWQGALALMSLASNIPLSLSELHALSSDILNLAGDPSVDASWYTKRLSVAAVYASAEVFMTRDQSPGFVETEAFVNRRFEDSLAIGEKVEGVTQCLGFMGSTAAGLGRSWGLKI